MKREFVIDTVNGFFLVPVLILVGLGCRVHYLHRSRGVQFVVDWLRYRGKIRAIDFQSVDRINVRFAYDEDLLRLNDEDAWRRAVAVFRPFFPLFPRVNNLSDKLYCWYREYLRTDKVSPGSPILGWIDAVALPGAAVTVLSHNRQSYERLIKLADHKITVFTIPNFPRAFARIAAIACNGAKRVFGSGRTDTGANGQSGLAQTGQTEHEHPAFSPGTYRVLFFPHWGLSYGNLYRKDHFYSDDPSSPLHPDNICHIETDAGVPATSGLKGSAENPCFVRPMGFAAKLLHAKNFIQHAWRVKRDVLPILRPGNLGFLIAILRIYAQVQHFRAELRDFTSAEVALIGYDVLFPKALAIALEMQDIKSVACEERTLNADVGLSLIADTFLCSAPYFIERYKRNRSAVVDTFLPVGMARVDYLVQAMGTRPVKKSPSGAANNGRKLVIALDYHSFRNPEENRWAFVSNWRANRQFLEDILRLARATPDSDFVLRGKNVDWMDLPAFQDIVEQVNQASNVTVNRDYAEYNVSYKLCAQADLVICRYTSLGMECLAAGIPVLFFDYLPNSQRLISEIFDFEGSDCLVLRYEDLETQASRILQSGGVNRPEDEEIRDRMFGGLNDGKARARILSTVLQIVATADRHASRKRPQTSGPAISTPADIARQPDIHL